MNWFKSFWKGVVTPIARPEEHSAEMQGRFTRRALHSAEVEGNFTPRAQLVLALARKEADRFNHNFVGTEHLLLGLISFGRGVAVNVLARMGLDLETVRTEVERQIGAGPDQKMIGNIPYTPRVKKVLALAAKEAKALNHTYVGTEHILLGLIREGDGVAARVLKHFDVDTENTRQEILKELDPNFDPATWPSPAETESETPPNAASPKPRRDLVDITKRYDVYCTERTQEVVVYRNALFKGRKSLFKMNELDTMFAELELADGQTIFIPVFSIIKFCEHGATPGSEAVPGNKS